MLQAIENMQESVLTTVLEAFEKLNPKAFNELDKVYGTVLATMLEAIGKIQMNVHVEGANKGGYHVSNTSASLKKENTPSTPPGKRATSLAYSPAKSETHTGGYVPPSQTLLGVVASGPHQKAASAS